jgi:TrmH family RNA methyltransferase
VKLLKSLEVKKKREEMQLILLEGHRVILDALNAGATPKHVMYSGKAFHTPLGLRLEEALQNLPRDCSVTKATDSVLDTVTETVAHQGLVAAFLRPRLSAGVSNVLPAYDAARSLQPLAVVLDKVRDPGNIGTLLRSCYGLGADAVVAVDGCDVWSPKVLRSAVGVQLTAGKSMPILEQPDWRELYDAMWAYEAAAAQRPDSQRELQIIIADGGEGSVPYTDVDFTLPSMLVIGSEASGVSQVAYDAPGRVVRAGIPMFRQLESFNAAVAGSILLAEAARQRSGAVTTEGGKIKR